MIDKLEVADLLVLADGARMASGADWADLWTALCEHTEARDFEAARQVRKSRVTAELGGYPYYDHELIPLWLTKHGYSMTFDGKFVRGPQTVDTDYVWRKLRSWNAHPTIKLFDSESLKGALLNWMDEERIRLLADAHEFVKYDGEDADHAKLRHFVETIIAPDEDPVRHERNIKAAMIALRAFMHRVKCHLAAAAGISHPKGQLWWQHKSHLMPIFYGPQGAGKSTAIDALCAWLDERCMKAGASFSIVSQNSDRSLNYQLSVMPVMVFDEMAGIQKAEVADLKRTMMESTQMMRQAYGIGGSRTLVTTFIGASNRSIEHNIQDSTGSRRFYQIEVRPVPQHEIVNFDFLAMWRAVDEKAVSPQHESTEAKELMALAQEEQRFTSPVEDWLASESTTITYGRKKQAADWYKESFSHYMNETAPGQAKHWSAKRLAEELRRIAKERPELGVDAEVVRGADGSHKGWRFRLKRPQDDYPSRSKVVDIVTRRTVENATE
ncbi:virulence-associated E family protein [Methylobacterium sp. SyP6R]|uniref:virulence-associated E family protein n=1 Tax=Methylobacterium sp. SyP6R TaxID=2718876 RepID=UPI001F2E7456|nr:virulence-associated E family protein [Methylobacterium sp. SyP6R]MCF4129003.1 virulence-associated E family protein [Methylobacterium sp. SyP6R]